MPRLSAITPYSRTVGSSRVRVFEWFDRLGMADSAVISLTTGGSADPGPRASIAQNHLRSLAQLSFGRSTLIHREASLIGSRAFRARRANRVVFDIDDALFADASESRRKRVHGYAQQADVLLCGNAYLAEWATQFDGTIVPMPSCVDPEAYVRKLDYTVGAPPSIVWLGSWSTERFLLDIGPALDELHSRYESRLVVVGSRAESELERRFHQYLDRVPWSIEAQSRVLSTADVGIMPVPDTPFTRGKCAYKLLQYGAAGLPLVGSPVGANREFLSKCGAEAPTSVTEWVDSIAAVLEASASEREFAGERARSVVEADYSFAAHESAWKVAFIGHL